MKQFIEEPWNGIPIQVYGFQQSEKASVYTSLCVRKSKGDALEVRCDDFAFFVLARIRKVRTDT